MRMLAMKNNTPVLETTGLMDAYFLEHDLDFTVADNVQGGGS